MPNSDDPANFERLFEEAEAKAVPPEEATNPPTDTEADEPECDHIGTVPHDRTHCKQCGKLICEHCWCVTDPLYCQKCMLGVRLDVKNGIYTDDDGVTHHGRVLTPTPQFNQLRWTPNGKTTAQTIHEMSDADLTEYVKEYHNMANESARAHDIATAKLSAATLEQAERASRRHRGLQGQPLPPTHGVSMDPKTGRQAAPRQSVAKPKPSKTAAAGVDNDVLMAIAMMLKQQADAKVKK